MGEKKVTDPTFDVYQSESCVKWKCNEELKLALWFISHDQTTYEGKSIWQKAAYGSFFLVYCQGLNEYHVTMHKQCSIRYYVNPLCHDMSIWSVHDLFDQRQLCGAIVNHGQKTQLDTFAS